MKFLFRIFQHADIWLMNKIILHYYYEYARLLQSCERPVFCIISLDTYSTKWSKLKSPCSELSIYWTTECKHSKILEYTIQDMGKWITWKKIVPKNTDTWRCTTKKYSEKTQNTHFVHILFEHTKHLYQYVFIGARKTAQYGSLLQ